MIALNNPAGPPPQTTASISGGVESEPTIVSVVLVSVALMKRDVVVFIEKSWLLLLLNETALHCRCVTGDEKPLLDVNMDKIIKVNVVAKSGDENNNDAIFGLLFLSKRNLPTKSDNDKER